MKSVEMMALPFFAGVFLVPLLLQAAVLVCVECGYESPEGSTVCSHCSLKLPAAKIPSQQADEPADKRHAGKMKFIGVEQVENEIKMARRFLESGDLEVANLFARNAATLEMLTDPKTKGGRADSIVEVRKKSESGGMTVDRKCQTCGGTGKCVMEVQSLDGKTTNMEVAGKSCSKCGGTGKLLKPSTMDERRFRLGRAVSRYVSLQQGRKYAPLGAAWIPAELDGNLSIKQVAQVKRAVPSSCLSCMGLGRTDCLKCKGQGDLKCTFSGCVNGKIEIQAEGILVKGKTKKLGACRNCGGSALVGCSECRSKGNIVCKKCNGSGERALCLRCGGQGFVSCKRCQGQGTVKDLSCADCRGEGYQECSGCNGDGRKK